MHRSFSTSASTAAKYYKVTLTRSTIGLSQDYRAAAKTLGLFRLNQSTYQPVNASTAGLILKLKEIVRVQNVDQIPEKSAANKMERGYKVVGRMLISHNIVEIGDVLHKPHPYTDGDNSINVVVTATESTCYLIISKRFQT
ncbi:hypothetical protein BDC45DRAFT_575120 [Circinella umbellata]|nr:hypothetical protein BDC45DRAFT_575120 [Circinella umbellata]